MSLLTVTGVSKFYGAEEVLHDISLRIEPGEHVALIGSNGAGKSTLLRIIAGLDEPDEGSVSAATGARVAYLEQEPEFNGTTLWDAMLGVFAESIDARMRLAELDVRMAAGDHGQEVVVEYGRLQAIAEAVGYDFESRIERVLNGLDLGPALWQEPVSSLSGGQRTRANLARLLLTDADLLLLDEPTNHLDIPALEWLEGFLKESRRAFLIVAHDRYLLNAVTQSTWELSDRSLTRYDGGYERYLELKAERDERLRREYDAQQEHIARTEEFIRRYGAGQRSKEARGREKRLNRLERIERPREEGSVHLKVGPVTRAGDIVLTADNLVAGYECPLLRLGDMTVRRGDRIALLGPNGSGKTSLLKTLLGKLDPLEGSARWGSRTDVAYFDQSLEGLRSGRSVLEEIQSVRAMPEEEARTYLGAYLFSGDDVLKTVERLSGGEKSRLVLAKLLLTRPNVLILDEPTNHLDLVSRDALEKVLGHFGGTILFVSHDRALIDAIARTLWVTQDGAIVAYAGTYTEYAEGRANRLTVQFDRPADRRDVFELEGEAARVADHLAGIASTASLRELEGLIDDYESLQHTLIAATDSWHAQQHKRNRSSWD